MPKNLTREGSVGASASKAAAAAHFACAAPCSSSSASRRAVAILPLPPRPRPAAPPAPRSGRARPARAAADDTRRGVTVSADKVVPEQAGERAGREGRGGGVERWSMFLALLRTERWPHPPEKQARRRVSVSRHLTARR